MRPEALLRTLVDVQAHLDEDLPLARLAARAGLSPHHFQRAFRRAVGETPRRYVERLRVERAAFRLLHHEGTLLELALECGFTNADTFTRAFRRRFGRTPAAHRARPRPPATAPAGNPRAAARSAPFSLSRTRLVRTRPLELAFLRHEGRYEDVPASLFDELRAWSLREGWGEPALLLGIGHDAPGVTPPPRLRFDAALPVPAGAKARGRIGRQTLRAGDWALTTHSGSFPTLPQALPVIFGRVAAMRGVSLLGLPLVEIYRTTRIEPDLEVQHTDIYVPVARRAGGCDRPVAPELSGARR